MEEKNNTREIAEIVENTMYEFNSAMKRREESIVRIGMQTTQIIRFSMVGLTLWAGAMFALIIILLSDMGNITHRLDEVAGYMKNISENITIVAENVHDVKRSLDHLNTHVKVMPVMNASVAKMSDDIIKINKSINKMNTNIILLNDHLDIMSLDIGRMTHQFGGLNSQLGVMGHNVDRMASPMKLFPFLR